MMLRFDTGSHATSVVLPFDLDEMTPAWGAFRRAMLREVAPEFTRDEWAYLAQFIDPKHLHDVFEQTFGPRAADDHRVRSATLVHPRGIVSVWLPNNISLLGPLVVILLSLTGNVIRLKSGTRAVDLVGPFIDFVRANAPPGALTDAFRDRVSYHVFDRDDQRNATFATESHARIVFGSDAAAAAIHGLPHPVGSKGISFADRRSEVWLDGGSLSDAALHELIKVFAIYGRAGCTSPARVVLLNGDDTALRQLRDRILALWPRVIRADVPPHVASDNVRALQVARATQWDALLAPRNAAVVTVGGNASAVAPGVMTLSLFAIPVSEAVHTLPDNIQTVGYAIHDPGASGWLRLVARTRIARFVPLGRMHHFGPTWDGEAWWSEMFERVALRDD